MVLLGAETSWDEAGPRVLSGVRGSGLATAADIAAVKVRPNPVVVKMDRELFPFLALKG